MAVAGVVSAGRLLGSQAPRIMWLPTYAESRGPEVIEFCAEHGLVLDEWQQYVLTEALGVRLDKKWAAFEVGADVSRQNGKGGILEARELGGIFLFGERLIIHSAHEFATASEAQLRMEQLLEEGGLQGELKPRGGIVRAHGAEGFVFKSGQRLRYRTRTMGGGRGFTGDTLILDEAMILRETFHGALLPTLSGRSQQGNPQVWYTGSAVDQTVHEHGHVFARVRERALRQDDPSLAYFEWSAGLEKDGRVALPGDVDAADLLDRVLWAQANPALGIRISEEHIEKEFRSMDPRTFAVERLGIGDWPEPDGGTPVIDMDAWDALHDPSSEIADPPTLALDVSPDRVWASIGAASWRNGQGHVEVVDRRRGTGWVARRAAEVAGRWRTGEILYSATGPAASLAADLLKEGGRVKAVSETEHAQACAMLFDGVAGQEFRHLGDARLKVAVKGATKRALGDSWAWSRRSSTVDITPLVAVTLAWWGARGKRQFRAAGF